MQCMHTIVCATTFISADVACTLYRKENSQRQHFLHLCDSKTCDVQILPNRNPKDVQVEILSILKPDCKTKKYLHVHLCMDIHIHVPTRMPLNEEVEYKRACPGQTGSTD